MLEDDGTFKIDASGSHSKLKKIHKNIIKNIDDIKVIEVSSDEKLQSSALLTLLQTIKMSKPDISIPLIDNEGGTLSGLGNFVIIEKNNSYA
jgi:hypothetical protein